MDRQRALDAFLAYVKAYDPENPRIALKVDHTLRVAALCERIAQELSLEQDDADLAWLLGLLHDIGRFEQVRRYDTFNDAISVSHAALGVEVLFDEPAPNAGTKLIRAFIPDNSVDQLLRTAIGTHSAYRLPENLNDRMLMFCNILRDADKIDILKVNCICPIQDIYNVTEQDMVDSPISPECVKLFYEHRCLPRGTRHFPADVMLGHICFAWELVFDQSLQITREQGHLRQMLNRTWTNPETQNAFNAISTHMESELGI